MPVADLASLPRGRAVVIASGARAALIETIPWWHGPAAGAVRASLEEFDPGQQPEPSQPPPLPQLPDDIEDTLVFSALRPAQTSETGPDWENMDWETIFR
jgi:hypothetical protein